MALSTSKGKGKTSERTPLLDEDGNPNTEIPCERRQSEGAHLVTATPPAIPLRSHLLTVALILLTVAFALVLAITLLAESYAAPALRNIDLGLAQPEGDKFWRDALRLRGPDAVNIVGMNRTEDEWGTMQLQVNASVTVRMTVDTDLIMGFHEGPDTWWTRKWKDIGRWGIRRLGSATTVLDKIIVYPSNATVPAEPLLTIKPLSPIPISLSPGLSDNHPPKWPSVTIPFIVTPSSNASSLVDFVAKSWASGSVGVQIHCSGLQLYGGRLIPSTRQFGGWRNWLKFEKLEILLNIKASIPTIHIPSHPPTKPGSPLPSLSNLLTLESFSITTASSAVLPYPVSLSTPQTSQPSTFRPELKSVDRGPPRDQQGLAYEGNVIPLTPLNSQSHSQYAAGNVIINALASLAHPLSTMALKLHLDVPLPIVVALPFRPTSNTTLSHAARENQSQPELLPLAEVFAAPSLNTTHVRIPLSGYLLPLSWGDGLADAISLFASSYLSYKPAAIALFSPLYPSMVMPASFPPPDTKLKLVRNVTIENMKIRPTFGPVFVPNSLAFESTDPPFHAQDLLASATVHAHIVLPKGVNIDVRVGRLWLDCFVYDGEVPSETSLDGERGPNHVAGEQQQQQPAPISETDAPPLPKPRPLPDPLPERAFARIMPKTWLSASSVRLPREDDESNAGSHIYVTGEIVDVPLDVLPGRGEELSRFITKVVFSKEQVTAGIEGVAAVGVSVPGLTASLGSGPGNSELVLTGLPFRGNVKIGGRR